MHGVVLQNAQEEVEKLHIAFTSITMLYTLMEVFVMCMVGHEQIARHMRSYICTNAAWDLMAMAHITISSAT